MNKFLDSINKGNEENIVTHRSLHYASGGRPKKAPAEKKTEKIFINLTKAEKEVLEKAASSKEMSLSSYIRLLLKNNNIM